MLQFSSETDAPRVAPAAVFKLCTAILAIACAPILIRLSETELGANGTAFNRLFVFLIVFGLGQWLSRPTLETDGGDRPLPTRLQYVLLVSLGVFSTASLGLWALSLQYTTVAKSMLLNNLTPIFTALGSWLLFGKRFDRAFLLGMGVALTGAIALGAEDLAGEGDVFLGDGLALLSSVFYSGYLLTIERLRPQFSATTLLLWRCAVGCCLLLPVTFLTEAQLFPTTNVAILAVIGLGVVSEGMGQRFLADCLEHFSSSFIALLALLEPILSSVFAWFMFAEQLSPVTWVGFAIVLTGIYLAQTSKSATQAALVPVAVEQTVEAEPVMSGSTTRA